MVQVDLHPSLILLIILVVCIQLVLPLGTYLVFRDRHTETSRLWFIAISLFYLGIILATLRPWLPRYLALEFNWMLSGVAWPLMIEVFRRELGRPALSRTAFFIWLFVWLGLINTLYLLDSTLPWGLVAISLLIPISCAILTKLLLELQTDIKSQGVTLLLIAMGLYGISPLFRLVDFLLSGEPQKLDVFALGFSANVLTVSFVIGTLFLCLGYWGYAFEKARREQDLSEDRERLAQAETTAVRRLLKERDRLLVMNSRISGISMLSSFAALLVHDFSNFLQTFKLSLDNANTHLNKLSMPRMKDSKPSSDLGTNELRQTLQELEKISTNVEAMLSGFRRLIMQGERLATPVCIRRLIEAIEPIAMPEAEKQELILQVKNLTHPATQVEADEVMLYRILMNFLLNSMQALKDQDKPVPYISLLITEEQNVQNERIVLIRISDNGPGYPGEILTNIESALDSKKQDGLGLGLLLSKNLVELWGGSIDLSNQSHGAVGEIRLRAIRVVTTETS